jgi:hypothetical protein
MAGEYDLSPAQTFPLEKGVLARFIFFVYNVMYKGSKEKIMAEMVRKQIYIEERHERLLKRISKARGVSEAEFIRQAIERETVGGKLPLLAPDQAAWDKILRFANSRKVLRPGARPYRWNRLDAYEERERRFSKREKGK